MDPYPSPEQPPGASYTAWQMIKFFWKSEDRLPLYLFFTMLAVLTVPLVSLHMIYTYWYNYFYEVLQAYDKHGLTRFMNVMLILAVVYLFLGFYRFYVSQFLNSRFKQWVVEHCLARLLQKKGYSAKENVTPLLNFTFDLSLSLIGTLTAFLAFSYLLWQYSDELTVSLGSWGVLDLHGYLLWLGAAYGLACTFYRMKFGRSLLSHVEHQWREAAFVFANYPQEMNSWKDKIKQKSTYWFRAGYYQATLILPLIMVLPNFFDKLILISWLIQSLQAFNRAQSTLTTTTPPSFRLAKNVKEFHLSK